MASLKKGEIVRLFSENYRGAELCVVDIKDNNVKLKYVNSGKNGYPTCPICTNIDKVYKI